ncbi:unnamed protein product [Polarella glacialis]|uniref:Uncharacterized protein n=1 Tax=Polarella glacialis TaxID=89957 RepID=A0A813HN54_POLGL|nr:unnamed protein product [Polarella glacialis]CAE8646273.1 unnamed protein product [Polarella glacialis]
MSTYVPTARNKNLPLFYSYSSCGAKDQWIEEEPKLGGHGCQCIGFDNIPGTTKYQISPTETASYPAEAGGTCSAWDMDNHPACAVQENKPDWCSKKWCYVDPCTCNVFVPPRLSKFLPTTKLRGIAVYYSYETCGEKDTFSSDECVAQTSLEACGKNSNCGWNGSACLGWERMQNSFCTEGKERTSAAQVTALAAAPAANFDCATASSVTATPATHAKSGSVMVRPFAALLALIALPCAA